MSKSLTPKTFMLTAISLTVVSITHSAQAQVNSPGRQFEPRHVQPPHMEPRRLPEATDVQARIETRGPSRMDPPRTMPQPQPVSGRPIENRREAPWQRGDQARPVMNQPRANPPQPGPSVVYGNVDGRTDGRRSDFDSRRGESERIREAQHRSEEMRRDGRYSEYYDHTARGYSVYREQTMNRYRRYPENPAFYPRERYRGWYDHGFRGGYYYELHPYIEIHTYFSNPLISWFYADTWNDGFYSGCYGNDYYLHVELQQRFARVGVFYPTVEFRDLNLYLSAREVRTQINYRNGMISLTGKLENEMSRIAGYPIYLQRNDIVVNHYQNLPYGNGVVLEGFVEKDGQNAAFKALLDLRTGETLVSVPSTNGYEPSQYDLDMLRYLNDRIYQMGGQIDRY